MAIQRSEERLSSTLLLQLTCLIVVAISFRLAILAYSSLPHTYPFLITLSGAPVAWVTKSWFNVLWLPLVQSGFFLLMVGLAFWVAFSRRSLADLLPVDSTKPGMLSDEMKKMRRRAAFFGSLISLLTLLAATYLNDIILRSESMRVALSRGPVLFSVVLLVFCIFASTGWLAFVLRISNRFFKNVCLFFIWWVILVVANAT